MDLLEAVAATPWLVPVLAASVAAGLVAAGPVGSALRCTRAHAVLLVAGVGLVAGATLTPGLGATYTPGVCTTGLAPGLADLAWFRADVGRNLLLAAPLGLAVGLLRPPRRRGVLVVSLVLLPVVELVQLVVPGLGRSCQVSDVAANLTGLVVAVTLGGIVERMTRPRRGDLPVLRESRLPVGQR